MTPEVSTIIKSLDLPDPFLSKEHVERYCDQFWPFLQVVDGSPNRNDEESSVKLEIITHLGWRIHDHGAAIILSPIHDHEAEGFSIQARERGVQHKLVAQVAKMVIDRSWSSMVLFDGTATMKTLLQIESKKHGLKLKGYTPQPEEEYYRNVAAQIAA